MGEVEISATDWSKGVFLSVLASIIGGMSKLAIRKSWLLQAKMNDNGRVGYEQRTLSAEGNLLRTEAPVDIANENDVSRDHGEQLIDEQRKNSNLVPYGLRYSGMFGMSVFNPICCVLAMNYASPSILAPFSGLTLVWVIVFSPLVNSEKPSSRQIFACCLIISGEVIVAIFGDHTNDEDVTVEVVVSFPPPMLDIRVFFAKNTATLKQRSLLLDVCIFLSSLLFFSLYFLENILQEAGIHFLLLWVNFISYFNGLLDQLFTKFHSSTLCLGVQWWCDHRSPELFEGQPNNNQSQRCRTEIVTDILSVEFHGSHHCFCWFVIPNSLYETI
jgi:hypothetical protein